MTLLSHPGPERLVSARVEFRGALFFAVGFLTTGVGSASGANLSVRFPDV